MQLTDLRTLGRSGLLVNPLTLGTMTMGNPDWGSSDEDSQAIFNQYVDAGGISIDTADVYSGGHSEELVGRFIAERSLRDHVVLATKYGFSAERGNPLAGGGSRKNLGRAVEGSLRRLGTDYLDLYWLHVWDRITPAEEVLAGLGDLVRAGKIRYYGLSDTPAWFATRVTTLAQAYAVPGPVALQLEYSLVERNIELEHVPAALELGLGIAAWSPLAGGFLAGKYRQEDAENSAGSESSAGAGGSAASGEGRLAGSNPFGDTKFTARNWATLDAAREVADKLGRPVSQVALAWAARQPGVSTVLLGTRTQQQLADNLTSLEVELAPAETAVLERASAVELGFPYGIFSDEVADNAIFGGTQVRGWPA